MPSRRYKSRRRIKTDDIQGEGSFVVISAMTYAHAQDLFAEDGVTLSQNFTAEQGFELLQRLILEWNWVDDDDEPLPIPSEGEGVLKGLPIEELDYLLGLINITRVSKEEEKKEQA